MNIVIKTDEQRAREASTLRDFGRDPRTATSEERELAEAITRRSEQAVREMEAGR